jgi:signal transduction histidine kinase/CheY-like chemotaxis protein
VKPRTTPVPPRTARRQAKASIADLQRTLGRLAAGELSARATDGGGPLGSLAGAVNELAQSVQSQFTELEQKTEQAAAEIARLRDSAASTSAAKSRFFAAASHDLRQPMHALSLLVSALKLRNRQVEVADLVDRIEDATAAMEDLFEALLDLSRLDAGAVEVRLKHFPLQPLLDELDVRFAPVAAEKGLRFRMRPCDATFLSDPLLLERMLANLISNAIRYTDDGGVLVGCRARGGHVRIEVRDTGRGISPEQHHAVFEEFVQLHNPERSRGRGLGLGLAIVGRLAVLLDHPLALRSQPERGSLFSLEVPRGDPTLARAETVPTAGDLPPGTLVVLVDDDAAILNGMAEIFDAWGIDLVPARDAEEALVWLAAIGRTPDLILSDYRLTGTRDGIDAIARMRRHFGRAVPAIVISGDTAPDTLQRVEAAGHPFLAKPLRPARLRVLIAHLLQQSRAPAMG